MIRRKPEDYRAWQIGGDIDKCESFPIIAASTPRRSHETPAPRSSRSSAVAATLPAAAQEKVLNLYSSRHYQTDEALYAGFTKKTGIKVNRIEANEDALIERLRNEGARSPADVLVTVDAGPPLARRADWGSSSP